MLYVLDSVGGTPRTVLDPQEISPDGSTAVGNYAVSPDGRWLAYSQARGGAVNVEMRVRDLATGGGLLIGAVMTQRPDLFAVALPSAGHYDMLRYHKFTVGAGWIPECGSADDSAAFGWLYAYSPLHHVRPGTCYPATLILAAEQDRTVVPAHSYKFAAALQAAHGCERPILLWMACDASHSYASAAGAIAERADSWAFVAARLRVGGEGR